MSDSVKKMWEQYLLAIDEDINSTEKTYEAWHFCNDEHNANELAELVLEGTKKATASAAILYEIDNDPLPKVGELSIITDWNGQAKCIIEVTNVEVVKFKNVTEEFARTEGEGDKSLDYWRRVHKDYFSQELDELGKEFSEDMSVVCERFEVVYK